MKKNLVLIVPLLLVLILSGCAAFFEFNLFAVLDPVILPDADKLDGMTEEEALDYLEEQMGSPTFMEKLTDPDNEKNFDAVNDYLDGARGTASTENERRASILYADLHLESGGGEEMVNNITELLLQGIENFDPADAEQFLSDILAAIVPEEALASQEAFNELLDGFDTAWDAYYLLGIALHGGADPPAGVNMGDVAQKALFASLIDEALRPNGLYLTEADAKDALWAMANGEIPLPPDDPNGFADPFEDPPPVGSNAEALSGIFDAVGLDLGT